MTEEICEELRHSTVLQDPLIDKEITLNCRRFTEDANQNELVVSVYVKDRSMDVSVMLAKYFQYDTKPDTVLRALNHTTIKVYVRRHTCVLHEEGYSE
jgi:hypothetical protein